MVVLLYATSILERCAMLIDPLLPGSSCLRLDQILITESAITVTVTTTQPEAICPLCACVSTRVHSRYCRTIADLPWAGVPVRLYLRARKFFCSNPCCRRTIFAERLPTIVASSARRTLRLTDNQRQMGLDHGGEAGARTLTHVGMPVSPDTVLRLVRRSPIATSHTPRVLGVDDWSWRKGRTYGTLLVDLEQHQPVDLLPDRTAAVLERWLKEHPGVEIISRDRAGAYADGATRGAPEAIQVADRFHLVQNLREALHRVLDRHQRALQAASAPTVPVTPTADAASPTDRAASDTAAPKSISGSGDQPRTRSEHDGAVRRARRQLRYEAILALHQDGWSIRAIARHLQVSRDTITRYIAAGAFPERARPRPRPSLLDAYIPYMRERWRAGCDNGMQLWRAIDAQGYTGSRALVARWVAQQRGVLLTTSGSAAKRRGRPPAAPRPQPSVRPISARRAAWLLIRRPTDLTAAEPGTLTRLLDACPAAATAYPLAQAFIAMVRARTAAALDGWLAAAAASGVPELHSFVRGLQRDRAAVRAGLTLTWSQGQVEGQVNRLKLIKRSMYGRANFDLLRQRVLAA